MATCAHCKIEETELYENGAPICLKCSEARMREFDEVMGHFPGGLPHPAGGQRIKDASNALTFARQQMATAHNRINDYISRGIVPEDVKAQRGKFSAT